MKVIKRNQIIILVMSLLLITAGYLNYTANIDSNKDQIAEVGDAALVSTLPQTEYINEAEEGEKVDNNSGINEEYEETANVDEKEDQYFIRSKLERDSMYSQLLETYQQIYNNSSSTAEQKTEAMREIGNISNQKNAIMIAENLITAKRIFWCSDICEFQQYKCSNKSIWACSRADCANTAYSLKGVKCRNRDNTYQYKIEKNNKKSIV